MAEQRENQVPSLTPGTMRASWNKSRRCSFKVTMDSEPMEGNVKGDSFMWATSEGSCRQRDAIMRMREGEEDM